MSLTEDDKNWIGGQIRELESHFEARIGHAEARLQARIEQVETNLLTEFHKWASPADARARTHSAALRALDLEMEQLSDRVKKIEDRKAS